MSSVAVRQEKNQPDYELLFAAPDRDGSVVSVRVHKQVKEMLTEIAEKEGLNGVSELVRYIIAGFLIGKYEPIKPDPKVLHAPIFLNINVNKREEPRGNEVAIAMEIDETMKEAEEFIAKVKRGVVQLRGNEYAKKLRDRLAKLMTKALRYGLEEEYGRLKTVFNALQE
ncbi:MAG: ribbon-helix-helix protein, CopG family [Thermocladium sp.]